MSDIAENSELVKRFVAPSMRRALQMVSEELGSEAVILSSQKTQRGVEVVVSLEPDYATRGVDVRREFGQKFDADLDSPMGSDSAWRAQAGMERAAAAYGGQTEMNHANRSSQDLARDIEEARERMLAAKRAAKEAEKPIGQFSADAELASGSTSRSGVTRAAKTSQLGTEADEENLRALQTEIADMRLLLEQQLWRLAERPGQQPVPSQVNMPSSESALAEHLERLGLDKVVADELLCSVGQEARPSIAWRNCMTNLSESLPAVGTDLVARGGVFALVGPTGVGKTTTIAKLAAKFVLENGPGKVAIVTTDTYRVGAHDQLRSLGRILGVPVRTVDKEHGIISILASLRKFPLILVDTAGFRHGDPLLKQQLKQLDSCPFMKRLLVLACNSQKQSLKASVHAYGAVGKIDACVLSKLDETSSLGEALSVILQENIPLAYTTNGQEIPADIQIARGRALVARAVGMLKESISGQNVVGI